MDGSKRPIRAGEALMRLAQKDPEVQKGILAAQSTLRAAAAAAAFVASFHADALSPVLLRLTGALKEEIDAIQAKSDLERKAIQSLMIAESDAARKELRERGFPTAAWTLESWCHIAKIVDVDPQDMTLGEIVEAAVAWSDREQMRARYVAREVAAVLPNPIAKTPADELSIEARAIAVLVEHPGWSVTKIAKHVGCSRQTLYDYELFKRARAALQASRADLPTGFKDAETGDLEAWD
jgi:hypothetical protein